MLAAEMDKVEEDTPGKTGPGRKIKTRRRS
jgi:hypothetical protein